MSSSRRRMKRLEANPAASGRGPVRPRRAGAGLASIVAMGLLFAGGAQAADAPVTLGTDFNFSVLGASTVTNSGPTSMSRELGLSPGPSVTGSPTASATHIDDPVAVQAQSDLVAGITDASGRASSGSAGTDLAGQTFTPGVYTASSALQLSAGPVILNAEGDPNAVFIFQVGSSLTTGAATSVVLINGAQPCNVFWQIHDSATLHADSTFVGTVLAGTSISAGTNLTMDGRLLAQTGAVTLLSNTITTSACSTTSGGTGGTTGTGGTGGTTGGGTGTTGTGGTGTTGTTRTTGTTGSGGTGKTGGTTGKGGTTKPTPVGSVNKTNKKTLAAQRRARHRAALRRAQILRSQQRAKRLAKQRRLTLARAHPQHTQARAPIGSGGFTG